MQTFLLIRSHQRLLYLTRRNISKLVLNNSTKQANLLKENTKNSEILFGKFLDLVQEKFLLNNGNKFQLNKIKYFIESLNNKTLPAFVNKLVAFVQNLSIDTRSSDAKIFKKLSNQLNLFRSSSSGLDKDISSRKLPDFGNENQAQQSSGSNQNNKKNDPNKIFIFSLFLFISSILMLYSSAQQVKYLESKRLSESGAGGNTVTVNPVQGQNNVIVQQNSQNISLNLHIKNGNTISWNDVSQLLSNKLVSQIFASKNTEHATILLKQPIDINGHKYFYFTVNVSPDDIEKKLAKLQDELNLKPDERISIVFKSLDATVGIMNLMVLGFLSYLVFNVGRLLFSKVQNAQSDLFSQFTKAKFTMVDPHLKSGVPKISFKDVAGLHEAKIEVKEFVDYLRTPERFTRLGGRVPKGALLLGPPGCGKTLLAKAVAAEANVPFFNIAGTEFIEMIGGVGAARVRSLFEEAKKQSPSIIYIDEIDAVGGKRSGSDQSGGSGELDQTLNQLLVSMDGLESNSSVIVLASTNRADTLDKALLRPGRLDRHITIDLPTHIERIEILNVHMRGLKLNFDGKEKEEFVSRLAHLTPRFSGADLANICNEAALLAARVEATSISKNDFEMALERVIAGPEKKTSTISVEDRRLLAYHECGHVLISWFHQYSDLILKVSLLSRTKANVFSQYLPSDSKIFSKEELFDQMCLHFGGRVAESLVFNRFTTNSEQDLKKITRLAYAQIESFGMSEAVGNMSFPTQQEEKANGGGGGVKPYSKKLRRVIDLEVNKLVSEAHKKAMQTVNNNIDLLHKLAAELLLKENLNYDDIVKLLGPPKNQRRYSLAQVTLNTASSIPIPNQ